MQVYFIDNEDYFKSKAILTDENGDMFDDNDERAILFLLKALLKR
jgi:starch synthase